MKDYKELRLGLDIGSNSIGWALLDENNTLVRKNGFTFWGVRMFEDGQSAKERGGYRKARRLLNRKKERRNLLKSIFNEEVANVDPLFFERVEDSFFKIEDKRNKNKYTLFNDEITDKDFFKKYPTIHHLRKHLLYSSEKADIRELYLALAFIITHRGHFLIDGDEFIRSDETQLKESIENINDALVEMYEQFKDEEDFVEDYFSKLLINESTFSKLGNIMINVKGINNRKKELFILFDVPKKSFANECIIPLLAGGNVDLSKMSFVKDLKYEKFNLETNVEDFDAKTNEILTLMPEYINFSSKFIEIKKIVDFYYVIKVLNNANSISDAMVNKYNEHQHDLKKLKAFFKTYLSDDYIECFKEKKDKLTNYAKYVGGCKIGNKKVRFAHCSRGDFYKYLKSKFSKVKDENAQEEIKYFLDKIDQNELLLRQASDQNGALPMQLNLYELKTILDYQAKFYPFLNKVEDGLSAKEKIISIFKFKLPYYVGPLNIKSKYAWVERTNEIIRPWNFNKVVNLDETAIKFIQRMQNKCTYLKGDDDFCLPKNSLLFSEYNCFSYLNKLNINGELISYELKNNLFNDVFLTSKQPTKKQIISYINSNYGKNVLTSNGKELPEVNCNMASYIQFKEIFGSEFEENIDKIEKIIRDIVIFEDKKLLVKRLKNIYNLSEEKIKQIKGITYKGYSSLSAKFLDGLLITNETTGEVCTFIDIMRKTNLNLQEILYNEKYNYKKNIDNYNSNLVINNSETLNEFINDNVSVSPLMKRPIIQCCTLINEIEAIIGRPINKYFVECTRTNKNVKGEKGKTISRYDRIKELYKNCSDIALSMNIDMKLLNTELEENKDKLKVDSLYLYFTQLGRCMYSLNPIDIKDLYTNNFDIDHIYPQSIIKDDSFNNRVLVTKACNADKTDKFLFETHYLNEKTIKYYEKLLDLGLITKEKFRRLTKRNLSQDELDGFVNRQLVTTNQSVKGLIEVLRLYKHIDSSRIIYSKGENVTDFRQMYDLVKSRTANNYHHAHDAYLNVVVGNVVNEYFNKNRVYLFKDVIRMKNSSLTTNVNRIFEKEIVKVGEHIIWNKKEYISKIKRDLYSFDPKYSIHETTRMYNVSSMFAKTSILPVGKGTVPMKTTNSRCDVSKYGGIDSNSFSRYVIVKTQKKQKDIYILEAIPKAKENDIYSYLSSIYSNYDIMVDNIKTNVIVEYGKLKYMITGKTNNQYLLKNAIDRNFSLTDYKTIKYIDKYFANLKFENKMNTTNDYIIISPAKNEKCSEIILTKNDLDKLFIDIRQMFNKDIYAYSSLISLKDKLNEINVCEYTIEDFILLINEILKLLKTNERKACDLTKIDLAKSFGVLLQGKVLKPGMKFISESITGYYKKVLFEVK